MKILFLGTPDFAVASLRALVETGHEVVGVVTMPDKPAGRGLKTQQSAVKQYATEQGLRVFQPEKLRDPAFLDAIHKLKPDLGVVIAFRMLPQVVWAMPRLGTLNLHASLLPQYRGAAPINWAIINGEKHTGVTTFMLNEEIDKGAILGFREVAIAPDDTAGTLHDKLMAVGAELVLQTVDNIEEIHPIEQPEESLRKPAPKIFRDDCRVDWGQPAEKVRDFIRGLSPYPAAWSELGAGETVRGCLDSPALALAGSFCAISHPLLVTMEPHCSSVRAANGIENCSAIASTGKPKQPLKIFAAEVVGGLSALATQTDAAPRRRSAFRDAHSDLARRLSEPPCDSSAAPGTIKTDNRTFLHVACADGWLSLTDVQLAGKRRMPVADLLRGYKFPPTRHPEASFSESGDLIMR